MTRVEKDRWKLPDHERIRIENILKRALDVEKGIVDQPSITEEHPDGCKYFNNFLCECNLSYYIAQIEFHILNKLFLHVMNYL